MNGIAAAASIGSALPDTEVLAITGVLEEISIVGAIQAGTIGSLFKDTESCALCQAIKAARGDN